MTDSEINEAVARGLGTAPKKTDYDQRPSDYCHSIKAAWEIVEQPGIGSQGVKRTIYPRPSWEWSLFKDGEMFMAEADTAPMAICLAFLKLQEGVKI